GLVEKDDVPGRRRVSYSLTRKGRRSITSSRLRMTFVVSILSLAGGVVSLLLGVQHRMSSASFKAAQATAEFEGGAGATAGAVDGLSRTAEPLFYPLGATLLVLGLLGLFYWSGRGR
ncbi:MAG: hypothetical protein SVU32_09750, partial [Candidatus Nanohaloarchaea archaeon]|nr:hypothetical protein [Candidatus Nanohaloarchaea archaeon]